MEKGKGKGIWVPAPELFKTESDSDEERVPAATREVASSSGTGADGASSSRALAAMEEIAALEEIAPFEDGQYVRLRNRGRGGYLFADETGHGVCIDRRRGMINTAWAVQILHINRAVYVLLRGAYGRYLSNSRYSVRPGFFGHYAIQGNFEYSDDHYIMWSISKGNRGSVVLVQGSGTGAMAVRANGRYRRWNTDVTVASVDLNNISSMMEWEVQIIPLTVERPPYQPRRSNASIQWREGRGETVRISFTFAWFADNGGVEYKRWMDMLFDGRNLTDLGNEIANRVGNGVRFQDMTLCVQAGNYGRPIPLLTDLPLRDDPVIILMFMVNSPGHRMLRFPNLAAQ